MKRLSYLFFSTIVFLNMIIGYAYSNDTPGSVLFLDVNDNPLEIKVARKAALDKGQKLVVYPEGKNQVTEEGLKAVFAENTFASLTISGHSGGMSFHGDKGGIYLSDLTNIIKSSSSKDTVQSLYLLGCNTGNKAKLLYWKDGLPNLKFIAGYDGIAPLGHNQLGLSLYGDALKKESEIINSQTVAQFKKSLESIKNIRNFPISLYAICGDLGGEFLYRPKAIDTEKFTEFDLEDCMFNKAKYNDEISPEIQQYMSGELEPTTLNPSNGRLKEIYVFARQNEHCFTEFDYDAPDGDALLHLRFMKDFNINFANYYKNDFAVLKREVDLLVSDPSDYLKQKNEEHQKGEALIDEMMKDDAVFEDNFGMLKSYYQSEMSMHKGSLEYGHCMEENHLMFSNALFGGNCSEHADSVSEYTLMKSKLSRLNDKKLFLHDLKRKLSAQKIKDVESIKENVNLSAMSATLDKIQKSPSTLSRKELLDLDRELLKLRQATTIPNIAKIADFLGHYRKIDSEAYPFSWHEAAPKDGVERPMKASAVSGLSSVAIRIPRELRSLTSEIEYATLDLSGF